MMAIWALAWAEIRDRRALVLAALVLGVLPLAAPLLPGTAGLDLWELRRSGALLLSAVIGVAFCALVGGGLLAGDLVNGRIGFYLSRPLSAASLWTGKLVGGASVVLLAMLASPLPSTLAAGGLAAVDGRDLVVAGGATLGLLALVHAAAVVGRVRSAWLALDGLAATLVAGLALSAGHRLWRFGAIGDLERSAIGLAIVASGAAIAAGWAQVAHGRTSARRAHGALSLTLWGVLLAGTVALSIHSRQVVTVEPGDLVGTQVIGAAGDWALIEGAVRGHTDFSTQGLLSLSGDGAWRQLDRRWRYPTFAFGPSGDRLVWTSLRSLGRGGWSSAVQVANLDGDEWEPRVVAEVAGTVEDLALSPTGNRLAVLSFRDLRILELPSGGVLAAVHRAEAHDLDCGLRWRGSEAIREVCLGMPDATLWDPFVRVAELAPGPGRAGRGRPLLETRREWRIVAVVPDGALDRMLLVPALTSGPRRRDYSAVDLVDIATGEVTELSTGDMTHLSAGFLSTGEIFVAGVDEEGVQLWIWSSGAVLQRQILLGPEQEGRVSWRELSPGRLLVQVRGPGAGRTVQLFDLAREGVVRRLEGFQLPREHRFGTPSIAAAPPAPGSLAAGIVSDQDGDLLRVDETGLTTPILPPVSPHRQ